MFPCPYCHGPATLLSVLSSVSLADFFQCADCRKISERPKGSGADPLPLLDGASCQRPPVAAP